MKIKTSELTGPALDRVVAECMGQPEEWMTDHKRGYINSPSTDWAQGGPIIEREEIALATGYNWEATKEIEHRGEADYCIQHGPTPLIAAMRCYVASKLGDTVDIPEELTHG
jgi:hypothetical protein